MDGDTITISHETKEIDLTSAEFRYIREECKYVDEGITSRAAEAIKNGQAITAAWVEKRETYESHTPYDEYDETPDTTTETIKLWVTFEGDLRPTRLTSNETPNTRGDQSPRTSVSRAARSPFTPTAHTSNPTLRAPDANRRASRQRRREMRQHERTPRPKRWPGRSPIRTQDATKHRAGLS